MHSTELATRYTEIDGLKVRHISEGSGPPVLLLHGWGASIETVASIISSLAPVATVHALDLPGFGDSDPPPVPWGVQDYRDFTLAFIDALRIERPLALVAHSNGGRIAIAIASSTPVAVSRMILIDSAGIRPRRSFTYYRKVSIAKVGKHAARWLGAPGRRLRETLVGRAASADYAAASLQMRPTLVKLVNSDLREMLPQIVAPTLLIWGDEDTATPLSDGELMEQLIPDAGLVVFEGAGHYSYLEQRARFATIARHFIGEARLGGEQAGADERADARADADEHAGADEQADADARADADEHADARAGASEQAGADDHLEAGRGDIG